MTCGHRIGARPNGPLLNNTLPQRSFCQLVIDGNCKEEPSLIKQPPANVTILKLSWMDPDHNKSSADFYLSCQLIYICLLINRNASVCQYSNDNVQTHHIYILHKTCLFANSR